MRMQLPRLFLHFTWQKLLGEFLVLLGPGGGKTILSVGFVFDMRTSHVFFHRNYASSALLQTSFCQTTHKKEHDQ